MKTKNRGFSTIEVLVSTAVVVILFALAFSFIKKKDRERANQQQLMSSTNNIILIEKGVIDRYRYLVFEDKSTKARIFYYNETMILLPKKEGM